MSEMKHGGDRKGAGRPRIMENPVRVTITLEWETLAQLKYSFGAKWQDHLRKFIAEGLTSTTPSESLAIDN